MTQDERDRFWRGLLAGLVLSSGLVAGLLAAWQRLRGQTPATRGRSTDGH